MHTHTTIAALFLSSVLAGCLGAAPDDGVNTADSSRRQAILVKSSDECGDGAKVPLRPDTLNTAGNIVAIDGICARDRVEACWNGDIGRGFTGSTVALDVRHVGATPRCATPVRIYVDMTPVSAAVVDKYGEGGPVIARLNEEATAFYSADVLPFEPEFYTTVADNPFAPNLYVADFDARERLSADNVVAALGLVTPADGTAYVLRDNAAALDYLTSQISRPSEVSAMWQDISDLVVARLSDLRLLTRGDGEQFLVGKTPDGDLAAVSINSIAVVDPTE